MKYTAKLTEDGQGLEFTLHYGKEKKSERRTMRVPGDFNDPQGPTPLGFEFVDFAKRAFFEGYRFCAGNYAHMSTVHIKKMLAEPVLPLSSKLVNQFSNGILIPFC